MTQKAKHWLFKKSERFTINPRDGGIVGSLIGLGFAKRIGLVEYEITRKGKEWVSSLRGEK